MNDQQRANLLQLADFLEGEADKLEHFDQFKMSMWRSKPGSSGMSWEADVAWPRYHNGQIEDALTLGCGTAACAAGWAVTLPGLEPIPEDFDEDRRPYESAVLYGLPLDWLTYIERVFGLNNYWTPRCFGAGQPNDPRVIAMRMRTAAEVAQ